MKSNRTKNRLNNVDDEEPQQIYVITHACIRKNACIQHHIKKGTKRINQHQTVVFNDYVCYVGVVKMGHDFSCTQSFDILRFVEDIIKINMILCAYDKKICIKSLKSFSVCSKMIHMSR